MLSNKQGGLDMKVRIRTYYVAKDLDEEKSKIFLSKFTEIQPTETEKINGMIEFGINEVVDMILKLPEGLKYDLIAEEYKGAKIGFRKNNCQ